MKMFNKNVKEYTEAEHICDGCISNIEQVRISPDEVTIIANPEGVAGFNKEVRTKKEPEYISSCKVGLINTPKVISCNQFEKRRKDR